MASEAIVIASDVFIAVASNAIAVTIISIVVVVVIIAVADGTIGEIVIVISYVVVVVMVTPIAVITMMTDREVMADNELVITSGSIGPSITIESIEARN